MSYDHLHLCIPLCSLAPSPTFPFTHLFLIAVYLPEFNGFCSILLKRNLNLACCSSFSMLSFYFSYICFSPLPLPPALPTAYVLQLISLAICRPAAFYELSSLALPNDFRHTAALARLILHSASRTRLSLCL